jgi:hypothetical protein
MSNRTHAQAAADFELNPPDNPAQKGDQGVFVATNQDSHEGSLNAMPWTMYRSSTYEKARQARMALDLGINQAIRAAMKSGLSDDQIIDLLLRPISTQSHVTCR